MTRNHRRKRGVSSVIGGLFVLLILVLGVTTFLYVSNLEYGVHQAANSAAQVDTLRNQEKLDISDPSFGGSETYSAGSSYVTSSGAGCVSTGTPVRQYCGLAVTTGSSFRYGSTTYTTGSNYVLGTREPAYSPFNITSSTTTGYQEAVSNMNFSSDISGWTVYTTSPYITGGFISTQGDPTPGSGVGSMFFASTCVSKSSPTGNESTRFFIDPSSTGVGTITTGAFSWAEYSPYQYYPSSTSFTTNVYLYDETSGLYYVFQTRTTSGDTGWTYYHAIASAKSFTNSSSYTLAQILVHKGYYDIIIDSTVNFNSCTSSSPQLFMYYDDIGLEFGYQSFVTDWNYAFRVTQTPTTVTSLSFSLTTSYNQSGVTQYTYLYNWVLGAYQLFSSNTVSTESTTITVGTSVTNTGEYSVQNLVATNGTVMLRMYSTRSSALNTGALGNSMETDVGSIGTGSAGLSATLGYTSKSAFTLSVYNAGPQPIEIVEIGLTDSNGHSYINATGIQFYNETFSTAITYDVVIYPLQTVTTQIDYTWTAGTMSLALVTARGNVFEISTTAS